MNLPRPTGASTSRTHWRERLQAWQAHHSTCAVESLLRLLKTPLQSALTWLVVAIAIALPATLYVALQNIQSLGYQWQSSSQISVFLRRDSGHQAIQQWRDELAGRPEVAGVDYVSPTQALDEFQRYSGLGRVLEDLEDNPLPPVLLVQPTGEAAANGSLEALVSQLRGHALVDDARLDMMWVKRLQRLIQLSSRTVGFLALLLAFGLLLVIGNTIRLAIENRRDEILVVKLVGGTDAYVRRPFLYTGLWYGLGGGLLAMVLLYLGLWWLAEPVAALASLYNSDFRLQGPGFFTATQLVLAAGLIGLTGAWLAVGRHLARIAPQ